MKILSILSISASVFMLIVVMVLAAEISQSVENGIDRFSELYFTLFLLSLFFLTFSIISTVVSFNKSKNKV
ncbi:MAG: hypothetical protein NTZ59_02345 [Bacteroidetes bacterium]|nr:hypothetical protein [Bacteroidota bacterium]